MLQSNYNFNYGVYYLFHYFSVASSKNIKQGVEEAKNKKAVPLIFLILKD